MQKTQIISAIQRMAAANGGVAPGWRRLQSEAGIRYSDWCGVHWSKWNDALREAGLAPNELTSAYTDEQLLEAYARLATELERLPTNADLRLKGKQDREFPNDRTFSRLGGKADLVLRLKTYCLGIPELSEIEKLASIYLASRSAPKEEPKPETAISGYVYLVKSGRFYKIGRTGSVGRREYELALLLPEKVVKIHVIETDDPAGIEAYWHKRFASKRQNGEWFDLDASDIAAFKRRRFM